MAAAINIDAYSDALVVLGTAGIVIPLVRRWGFSPVLGYLGQEHGRSIPFASFAATRHFGRF